MKRARKRWQFGLTDAGRVVLRGMGFVFLAALIIPALGVLAIMASIMLTAMAVGYVLRPRVRLTGNLPDRIVAGQTAQLAYTLRNVGRMPCYGVYVRFGALPSSIQQVAQSPVVPRLAPGEQAEVIVSIEPTRRGSYQVHRPICESSFPFNLFHFGTPSEGQENLLVLPAFSQLHLVLPHASRHVQSVGPRQAGRTGVSPEYVGNRPFLPGDSPRRIDVRAWARLAVPATKQYDDAMDNFATLVLDTRRLDSRPKTPEQEIPEFEAAISLCASVAYTIHADCLIDTLLAGTDAHSFAAWPKASRIDRIHEVLASIEPSKEYDLDQIGPLLEGRLHEVSEVVFILRRWDATYKSLVSLADRAGCHCTVIVVGEPSDDDGPSAAAEGWWGDVRFVTAEAVRKGQVELL